MLRGFYEHLRLSERIFMNPTDGIEWVGPRHPTLPKDIPDKETIFEFLNLPDTSRPDGVRDKAVLETLYSTGLRSKELRDLRLSDVDLKQRVIRVRCGKGSKGRMVPLGAIAADAIQRYLESTRSRHLKSSDETHLFLTERGGPLKDFNVRWCMIRYRAKLGAARALTAHTLRHACALHMLRGGAPIESISELLGHSRLSTTQIYTRLYPKDLKTAHQAHHPRDRMKI
jgi:integrase/recombinase XerD